MSDQEKNQVLIVGAGPTGMVLGIELARRGVKFRMIEKRAGPSDTSRSFTLHAKTMEMFEHMGIARRFLEDGIPSRGFYFNFKGKDVNPTLDFTRLETPYPYILIYNQNQTENRLREHLDCTYDVRPEWSTALSELTPTGNGYRGVLSREGRDDEQIEATWVIGCDGVHSFVRGAAGLDFTGTNYDGMVMQMMDVEYDNFDGGDDWVHYYMSKESFLLITKLPSGDHRVLISDMGEADDPSLSPREAFQRLVDGHVDNTSLAEPRWATKWDIWKRIVSDYNNGNIYLAGDAAHVHSPSGGQGMNAGMQDAFNLGWKLALVVRGQAKRALLDTYVPERKPIGEQVIAGTDAMHDIIMAHGLGMEDRLKLTQEPDWHEQTVSRISGLSYHYRDVANLPSDLAVPDGQLVGDRAPDVQLSDSVRLFDVLRHPRMTLLIAAGSDGSPDDIAAMRSDIAAKFSPVVEVAVVSGAGSAGAPDAAVHVDENGEFASRYGQHDDGHVYLVRPDGYIAYHGLLTDRQRLLEFMDGWLVAAH